MESTREQLIKLLESNKDDYISGQELSNKLQISRTAVWKHMKELEKDGYTLVAIPRKGYKVTQFPSKISTNTLQWGLKTTWLGRHLIHKHSITSTQTLANQMVAEGSGHGTVIVADEQTAGRGRMERTWYSKKDHGIWLSLLLRPNLLPHQAPQITLLAATVLAEVIDTYLPIKPSIKWPNDILINNKKLAGILTEMQGEQDKIQYMVLGMGINVNQSKDMFPKNIENIATSLKMQTGIEYDRRDLIQRILKKFEQAYDQFIANGFVPIKEKWETYGYKLGESVEIVTPKKQWKATLIGIEADGALIVKDEQGKTDVLYSAEIKW